MCIYPKKSPHVGFQWTISEPPHQSSKCIYFMQFLLLYHRKITKINIFQVSLAKPNASPKVCHSSEIEEEWYIQCHFCGSINNILLLDNEAKNFVQLLLPSFTTYIYIHPSIKFMAMICCFSF